MVNCSYKVKVSEEELAKIIKRFNSGQLLAAMAEEN